MINPIKIWLDDERNPIDHVGDDWIWVKTVPEYIALFQKHGLSNIFAISLDHDLGAGYAPGYDVLLWIEEQVGMNHQKSPQYIYIHTANPSARIKMMAARKKIYELMNRS
jgi:hypothetical protein